jgi:hypothetical protein
MSDLTKLQCRIETSEGVITYLYGYADDDVSFLKNVGDLIEEEFVTSDTADEGFDLLLFRIHVRYETNDNLNDIRIWNICYCNGRLLILMSLDASFRKWKPDEKMNRYMRSHPELYETLEKFLGMRASMLVN